MVFEISAPPGKDITRIIELWERRAHEEAFGRGGQLTFIVEEQSFSCGFRRFKAKGWVPAE